MPPKAKAPPPPPSPAQTSFEWIEIDKLRFDPLNPRLAEQLPAKATQEIIQQTLLGGSFNAKELIPSLIANGYLPYEPLVVRPKTSKGTHEVLEGNRRLAALISLRDSQDPEHQQAFKEKNLGKVACLIFQGTPDEELAYLGLRHLSKTKDWSTSAKGAFVERFLRAGKDLNEAGRIINTTPTALRTLLLTRRLFERAVQLGFDLTTSDADGEIAFWHLGDAIRRAKTKKYLGLAENPNQLEQPDVDESRFEKLIGWLYGNPKTRTSKIIGSIRDIPDLDSILGNSRATAALEGGSTLEEALEELQSAGVNFVTHVEKATRSLNRALAGLSSLDADGIAKGEAAIHNVDKVLNNIKSLLKSQRQAEERGDAE